MTYKEKMTALKCVVVMPTYNNAGTIAQVIAGVRQYAPDVIVVNDGSTDQTAEILRNIEGIKILDYPDNRGKGYALKFGLKRALEWGYRYAITIDSDGQHYADDIPIFIDRIEEEPDSLLIGARNLTADNMPSKNTFANKFSNFWYKVETGKTLADTQSGYRLYPLEKLRNMHFITRGYEFEVEVIVRAAWRDVNVENVPIKVYYAPTGERVSHFKPLRDFTRISILNTFLMLYALIIYYPWRFVRKLHPKRIKNFFEKHVAQSIHSNTKVAASMGWGVFVGILPIWGCQMLFARSSAHLMRLSVIVATEFSNVSILPTIPLILYGSMALGGSLLNIEDTFLFQEMSFEAFGYGLCQYLIGSCVLASIAGIVVFILALPLLLLFRKGVRYE